MNSELLIRKSISDVFPFFADPQNLARITPPSLRFRVTSKDVVMKRGAEIEYSIRVMGLPMHWISVISEYEPPFLFVDEQAKGPYRHWKHTHTFRPVPEGTLIQDHVEYSLPFGPFGAIAQVLTVRGQLKEIFQFRQKVLSEIFAGDTVSILDPVIAGK